MDPAAAEMMARGMLWLVGTGIKMSRSDKLYTEPSGAEKAQLAKGLVIMQARRASWIGAVDDILLVAGALGGYSVRAVVAPKQEVVAALPEAAE
jgi:hypothetical protein